MKNITLFIILLFHFEIALSHNLSANDRKNMNHEHKKILVQNVTANDSLAIWKNLMKNEYDPEINSDYNNLIKVYKVLEKMYLSKILFSPTLKLNFIIRKILIKFGGPIVLLDWFRLYHFVNAK